MNIQIIPCRFAGQEPYSWFAVIDGKATETFYSFDELVKHISKDWGVIYS